MAKEATAEAQRLEELGEVDPSIEEDIEDGKNKINLIRRQKFEICLSDPTSSEVTVH